MKIDWTFLDDTPGFSVEEPFVDVSLSDERTHRVEIIVEEDGVWLRAFVAKQAVVSSLPNLPVDLWQRNRSTTLVAFRLDRRNRAVAECHLPSRGLTNQEVEFCLRKVAIEADQLEFLLTGRDVH